MDNMKEAFLNQIKILKEELSNTKFLKGKEVLDIKRDLRREEETKRLILKKLSIYIKI